jgi:hypothetical protein
MKLTMKNVWKGLIIGGLTGVAAGAALDLSKLASSKAVDASKKASKNVSKKAVQMAPAAADRARAVAASGAAHVHDAEVGDHVKQVSDRIAGSDMADQARRLTRRITAQGAQLAHSVANNTE